MLKDGFGTDALHAPKIITGTLYYRLTLHPLAKYPGSLFARLTDWVTVYQTSTGDRHLDHLKEHKKYGACDANRCSFEPIEHQAES